MQPQKVQTSFRVRYAETDQMGVVYYSNYLVWMEVARVAYCRAVGFEYRDMEHQDGAFLAVTEANCKYRVPARFDDEVCITCWVSESRSRSVCFPMKCIAMKNFWRLVIRRTQSQMPKAR